MSSSGRFQSHLFNFVSRHAQKLADTTGTMLRHLKVATIWGTQILLYPVYALFQSTRLVGRQLGQTARQSFRRLKAGQIFSQPERSSMSLAVDTPIQRVLTAVQTSWLPSENEILEQEPVQATFIERVALVASRVAQRLIILKPQPARPRLPESLALSLSSLPSIQGIASLIPTGKLVLVATDNQIVDILTSEQQAQLRQRIIWELASYWRAWRQRQLSERTLLPIVDRVTLLPPVRVFYQLMAWVQRGPIAIAANLFQEAAIVAPSGELEWFAPDVSLAAFNPTPLVPRKIPTTHDFHALIQQLPTLNDLDALIQAAVRYFFGDRGKKQLEMNNGWRADSEPDPWLTSSDVFGDAKVGSFRLSQSASLSLKRQPVTRQIGSFQAVASPFLKPSSEGLSSEQTETSLSNPTIRFLPAQPTVHFGNSIRAWLNRLPSQKSHSQSNLDKRKPRGVLQASVSQRLSQAADSSHGITAPTIDPKSSTQTSQLADLQGSSSPSFEPDWIEAKVTPIGYVTPLVQRILNWFDQGMAAIEKILIAVWNGLTRF